MPPWLRRLSTLILDLLFPLGCLGCGQEGVWLCVRCQATLPKAPERCPFCTMPSSGSHTCKNCTEQYALSGLTAATIYHFPLSESLIQHFKYRYAESAALVIGALVAEALKKHLVSRSNECVLVPIPLHPRRERERGFNQSECIARVAAQHLGLPYANGLLRIRETRRQATLSEQERLTNTTGAFRVKKTLDFSRKNVILVDDVSTTGSTLENAARACRESGARSVWGLVFARSDRPARAQRNSTSSSRRVGPPSGDLCALRDISQRDRPQGDRGAR